MKADVELITTGAELLNGRTVNRHAQTLGDHLRPLGLHLTRDTTVSDDRGAIAEAVRSAMARVDIVFVSGGLGPTSDDVTRDAVADVFHRRVVLDEASLHAIALRYARAGRAVSDTSKRQALIVEGFVALPNSAGAAPGEFLEENGALMFLLPGPPREFLAVLTEQVLPILGTKASGTFQLLERILLVCGLPEADIAEKLEQIGLPDATMDVAYCAFPGGVEVRPFCLKPDPVRLQEVAGRIRSMFGDNIYAEERVGMEQVVGRLLTEHNATLATAESCTGGLIGHRLTNVSGSSAYYLGGVVAYANAVKARDLGVSADTLARHGAVNEEVARAMAEGVRARFGADYGLAVTGIAGPDGGTPDKPVGTVWLAVADARGTTSKLFRSSSGDREWVKTWSSQMALDLLRRRLLVRRV